MSQATTRRRGKLRAAPRAARRRRRRSPCRRGRRVGAAGAPVAAISSPSPRLDAAHRIEPRRVERDRLGRLDDGRPVRELEPPGRAARARTRLPRRPRASAPPRARCSAAAVPSPPSATGNSSASAPPRRSPSPSAAAAAAASRTPLRLAGHASARTRSSLRAALPRPPPRRSVGVGCRRHAAQARERQALVREEDQPEADADRSLDRLQPEAERDTVRVGHAVRDERNRDRHLDGADVARARAGRSSPRS